MSYRRGRCTSPCACTACVSPLLFLTFALYVLCPRFDSFDSFAMERENAATRTGKPLANDVKVRSIGPPHLGPPKFFSRLRSPTPTPPSTFRCHRVRTRRTTQAPSSPSSTIEPPSTLAAYRLNVAINCSPRTRMIYRPARN